MRPLLPVLAACGLMLAAAACSGGAGSAANPSAGPSDSPAPPASPTPTGSPSSPASSPIGVEGLTIVVDDGTGTTSTWTLTCQPPGGTHPDPAGACAALQQHRSALDPVPKDKMCAQVFGGPERATISGTWQGQPVSASLSRVNACETARWDALVPAVPPGGR